MRRGFLLVVASALRTLANTSLCAGAPFLHTPGFSTRCYLTVQLTDQQRRVYIFKRVYIFTAGKEFPQHSLALTSFFILLKNVTTAQGHAAAASDGKPD
jgi:hypothetical protein